MAKQRRAAPVASAPTKRKARAKTGGGPKAGGAKPRDIEPADPATLLQDGGRPHETTLQGTELEDFGLDVLPVVQPHKA
jgi:hypothetical protein